jgi:hypothetical protein
MGVVAGSTGNSFWAHAGLGALHQHLAALCCEDASRTSIWVYLGWSPDGVMKPHMGIGAHVAVNSSRSTAACILGLRINERGVYLHRPLAAPISPLLT